jgi:4-hydroxybenzoate polyprenyltransferase
MVPLLTSHKLTDVSLLIRCAIAICALSLVASATYILNDLFDIEADRRHAFKRLRPIPSGDISVTKAISLAVAFAFMGLALAMFMPKGAIALMALYVAGTLSYTIYFKQKLLVDVLLLAGLYTLRVLLGGAVTGISISFWLLAFSIFVFTSLALVKRVTELKADAGRREIRLRRGYEETDERTLISVGIASGVAASLVLALYLNSPEVRHLYARPEFLWLLCPLLLYWFSRVWVMVEREEMHDDPLVFVLRDRASRIVLAIGTLIIAIATLANKLPLVWLIKFG